MEYFEATGRRKESMARVKLVPGRGRNIVNGKSPIDYFRRPTLVMIAEQPLTITSTLGKYDIFARVSGGGISGQAGAMRLGISRALMKANPDYRLVLRQAGLLTRDSREHERKKYGLAKRRKRFQFSKR